ncbi:MAG: hypothetical protein AB8G22_09900 [Saprospiraceae bacterium]
MKNKITYSLLLLLFCTASLFGQRGLAGVWKGKITKGGIHSSEGYDFELYLEVDGKDLRGKTYTYLPNNEIIEMQVRGYIFKDRSLNLFEYEFIPQPEQGLPPDFDRKYQLVFKNSAFESQISLNGYWQQVTPMPFMPERKRGRIFLKKVTVSKA